MKKRTYKGSYTIEAAIYIPILMFLFFQCLDVSIDFWMKSKNREVFAELENLNVVKEFYMYQIVEEIEKELGND